MKSNLTSKITTLPKIKAPNPAIKRYIKLIVAGIVISISTKFFVVYANIFSPGVGGVSQGITYVLYESFGHSLSGGLADATVFNNTVYWIIYGAFNIPIIWFTYVKFGKHFLRDSLVVMAASLSGTMMFTFAPAIQDAAFIPGFDPTNPAADPATVYAVTTISGILGGVIYGSGVGIVFSEGVSSMGIDPIAKFMQRDKGVNIKKFLFYFSFANSVIWILVTSSMKGDLNNATDFWSVLVSPRMLGAALFLGTYALTTGNLAKDRKVKVEINSALTAEEFKKLLIGENFHRGWTTSTIKGGYSGAKRTVIQITLFQTELNELVSFLHKIDPHAFITATEITETHGNFDKLAMNKYEKEVEQHRANRKLAKTAKK